MEGEIDMSRLLPLQALNARLAFNLWGWATFLVVLLSAAPTGGALRTQWIGSAFDPASYSLTTGAKRFRAPTELRKEALEPGAKPVAVVQRSFAVYFSLSAPAADSMAAAAGLPDAEPARVSLLARNLAPRGPPGA